MQTRDIANENGLLVEDKASITGRAALESLGLDLHIVTDCGVHLHEDDTERTSLSGFWVPGTDDSPDSSWLTRVVDLQTTICCIMDSH